MRLGLISLVNSFLRSLRMKVNLLGAFNEQYSEINLLSVVAIILSR